MSWCIIHLHLKKLSASRWNSKSDPTIDPLGQINTLAQGHGNLSLAVGTDARRQPAVLPRVCVA